MRNGDDIELRHSPVIRPRLLVTAGQPRDARDVRTPIFRKVIAGNGDVDVAEREVRAWCRRAAFDIHNCGTERI